MAIGDKFYRFEAIDETDMGAQFLIECTIVDINSVTVEQDEDGVIQVTEKQVAEPEINDDDDDVPQPASQGNGKYRLEPEGDLFRLYATRQVRRGVYPGTRGGLVEDSGTLSADGSCWIDEGSTVAGRVYVGESAWVRGNSRLGGSGSIGGACNVYRVKAELESADLIISGEASVTDVTISGDSDVVICGNTEIRECVIEARAGIQIRGGRFVEAHIRNHHEHLSVYSYQWGWVSAFRDTAGRLVFTAGCERGDADEIRRLAIFNDTNPVDLGMLEHFIAMAQAAQAGWHRDPAVPLTEAQFVPPAEIVMVPAAEPAASAPSFADLAQRARAVNLDDPALLRDQMIADPPQLRRSDWD